MSPRLPKPSENPSATIERAFAAIAAGPMRDLPINNPALHVEAVGFGIWENHWLGVLITPWTLSLMLLPADASLSPFPADSLRRFPSGAYEFLDGFLEALGPYQTCSLFSPPAEFSSQDQARQVATEALVALLREEADDDGSRREAARLEGRSVAYSRRAFLRGDIGGSR